jgi:hypothetical protein
MNEIPRIVEEDEKNMVAKMVTMILGLPRPKTEAFTVFPGRGENERLRYAMEVFNRHCSASALLVAGTEWKTETTTPQPTIELLRGEPYKARYEDDIHIQYHAHCTPDQTGWVVEKVKELRITSLSLVVTPYHLPRAYLTLLKEFIKQNVPWIPLIPLPVPKAPGAIVPEDNTDAWTLFDGEAERILKYQKQGDVATLPEIKEYLAWLWKQPLLQQ